jgi:AcrR family transcriptional regulator
MGRVTPRPYQPVQRQRAVDEGRERIIVAARELLEAEEDDGPFSIDAVARRAGVARMTVYNQFGAKAGLLEALFDHLAVRGELVRMPELFAEKDPVLALDAFVALFGRFWTANRRAHRRLRAAALHDPDLAAAIDSRNERRRRGLTELARRLGANATSPLPAGEVVNVLFVLLSFDTFDALAGEGRTPAEVTPLLQRLARLALGVEVR